MILDTSDNFSKFKGAMTENFVLCELKETNSEDAYYWKSKNTAEVDFVVQVGSEIVPIEVKSEKNDRAKSLAEYRKKYEPNYSVKTSMKILSGDEKLRNIPLYLISQIEKLKI